MSLWVAIFFKTYGDALRTALDWTGLDWTSPSSSFLDGDGRARPRLAQSSTSIQTSNMIPIRMDSNAQLNKALSSSSNYSTM